MQMQRNITFQHKSAKRQFVLSTKTKAQVLKLLIKRAFHLQSEIKCLKHIGGFSIDLHQVFNFPNQNVFEILLQDDTSEDKQKSQVCSQKNMSKLSGRKHPPSQRQLLDSKFYIDDFQFFMSEVQQKKSIKHFGILFFSNKKKALFLGKKILRELIFQFDQIQFFYALHPIKMHNTSALLGQVLVFSLFKGKKMVNERQFPQQITAAQQIVSYIKNLIKIGDLVFNSNQNNKQKKRLKPKNLISVSEQRSFDQKNQIMPQTKYHQDHLPKSSLTTQFFKMKSMSPQTKQEKQKNNSLSPIIKFQSPVTSKSPPSVPIIPNQISFQNQFYQPSWFYQGNHLSKFQKSFLSALIKTNDQTFINFSQGLDLKQTHKEKLNIKLVQVFLQQLIKQKFSSLSQEDRLFIEMNQDNRQSYVFSALLKLSKFGNFNNFIQTIKKNIKSEKKLKTSYVELAKQIQAKKRTFSIRLMGFQQLDEQTSPLRTINDKLIGQHPILNIKNTEIANLYHKMPVQQKKNYMSVKILFSLSYSQADIACIKDLIYKNDAFLIQNFIPNPRNLKRKFQTLSPDIVKKYSKSIQQRYQNIRERTNLSKLCKSKLQKLQIFMSLLYYLYKQRIINKKQLKAFFYLYTWSDLNLLSAFQLYLMDRDLDEFIETIYSIDYTYYLQGKYGIDMNEVQQFTVPIESQLIILFLLADYFSQIEQRLALQKFARAGDLTLYKIYHDFSLNKEDFINKVQQLGREKRIQIQQHSKNENKDQLLKKQKIKDRCIFIEQIVPVHFKTFKQVQLVKECIQQNQPTIISIFDVYDSTNELMEWIQSFEMYTKNIFQTHMSLIMEKLTKQAGYEYQKLKQCRNDLVRGIYQSYMVTKDQNDAIDSIKHLFKKKTR